MVHNEELVYYAEQCNKICKLWLVIVTKLRIKLLGISDIIW